MLRPAQSPIQLQCCTKVRRLVNISVEALASRFVALCAKPEGNQAKTDRPNIPCKSVDNPRMPAYLVPN